MTSVVSNMKLLLAVEPMTKHGALKRFYISCILKFYRNHAGTAWLPWFPTSLCSDVSEACCVSVKAPLTGLLVTGTEVVFLVLVPGLTFPLVSWRVLKAPGKQVIESERWMTSDEVARCLKKRLCPGFIKLCGSFRKAFFTFVSVLFKKC